MELSILTQLINNVGFPIALCVALFYQNMKTNDSFNEFKDIVNHNTNTIERLTHSIETLKSDKGGD